MTKSPLAPRGKNHDMELVDYLRLLGAGVLHETAAVIDTIHAENDTAEERRRYLRLCTLMTRLRIDDICTSLSERGIYVDNTYRVEVAMRNAIVLDAISAAIRKEPDQKISLLWGAGHGCGIAKGLEEQGYRQVDRDWRDVMSVGESRAFVFLRNQFSRHT